MKWCNQGCWPRCQTEQCFACFGAICWHFTSWWNPIISIQDMIAIYHIKDQSKKRLVCGSFTKKWGTCEKKVREDITFLATVCSYLHTFYWIQILGCKFVPWCNFSIFLAEHMSVFHKVSQDVQTLSDAILKGRRDYSSVWVFPISKPQNIYHG